jgi:copper transport protein
MTLRGWGVVVALAVVVTLLVPAAASAHAYLIKTFPSASTILDTPPPDVALTFDEAVEPRFAIISVTDKDGHQVATASPSRSPSDPDTLVVPLKPNLPEGWYLVYWRAISVDGHPVQGAFTFAVGPNPGPAPQFVLPHIASSATTPQLVAAKWFVFLTVLLSVGLLAMRLAVARPAVRRVAGTRLRAVTVAFAVTSVLGLLAIPIYLEESTAIDSLHSFWDVGALVPLWRTTAFGRSYVDLLLIFALFVAAAWVAIWVDRPEREQRSIAEILAGIGVIAAAAAALVVPAAAGHAAQTSPRGLAMTLDWLHVSSAALWIGGLAGLLLVWRAQPAPGRVATLSVVVPRFSNLAFVSVLVLLGSGIWASVLHLPILSALWTTSYGQAIMVKATLLACAMLLGAVNLLRTKPRLAAAKSRPELAAPASSLLRLLVSGEVLLAVGALLAAATLTSLAPPSKFLASEGSAAAHVGPGKVAAVVQQDGYTLKVLVDPNKAVAPNTFALQITKDGRPVTGADATVTFEMLDMEMGTQEFQLKETSPGLYSIATPALVMVGHWGLNFSITPKGGQPFNVLIVDHAAG